MVELPGTAMIDILIPVLNRPQNARPLIESIQARTVAPRTIYFLCSQGDDEQISICEQLQQEYRNYEWRVWCRVLNRRDDHDYPVKMNWGLYEGQGEWILLASDDLEFQAGWDFAAMYLAEQTGAGVIGTNDKANGSVKRGKFSTHCLIRRTYIEEYGGTTTDGPGVIFHEGYDHNFVDRELCGVAMHRGQWAFAQDSVIVHRHPNWRTAPMDSTYEKGLATFHQDQKLFFERAHTWEYAGLNPAERRMARRTVRA